MRTLRAALAAMIAALAVQGAWAIGPDGSSSVAPTVAEFHVGDSGHYETWFTDQDGNALSAPRGAIDFAYERGTMRSADGRLLDTLDVRVRGYTEWDDGWQANRYATIHHTAGDDVIGFTHTRTGGYDGRNTFPNQDPTLEILNNSVAYAYNETHYKAGPVFCGLQPTTMDCALDFQETWPTRTPLPRGNGTQVAPDASHIRLHDGTHVRLQYEENIPVPTLVEHTSHETVQVWRLASFERGSKPAPDPEPTPPLGPLGEARRTPWSIDDSGLLHPFPLSHAYQQALADTAITGLGTFLQQHPDAYVAWTRYDVDTYQGTLQRTWRFGVTDGTDQHLVAATLQQQSDHISLRRGGILHYDPFVRQPWSGDEQPRFPTPDQLPESWPTAAAAHVRWSNHAPDRTGEPHWEFTIQCGSDCRQPRLDLGAGVVRVGDRDATWVLEGAQVDEATSILHMDHTGKALWLQDDWYHEEARPWKLGKGRDYGEPGPPTVTGSRSMPDRQLPQAASIGLTALAAGAITWLWPTIKSTAWSLFSRLRPERLLRQETRKVVMQCIEQNPGIHMRELMRKTGRAQNVVRHHLQILEQGGHVSVACTQGYRCYYPKGQADHAVVQAMPSLRSKRALEVLTQVARNPGIGPGRLAAAIRTTPHTVTYHAKRMEQTGLLERRKVGREMRLTATETGRMALHAVRTPR